MRLDTIDLRLAVTDSPVGDLPWMIPCREKQHEDSTASMAVYPDHLYCFGCGRRIRHRMVGLAYLLGVSPNQAQAVAEKYTFAHLDAYRARVEEEVRKEPLPGALASVYQSLLLPLGIRAHRREWLLERGLSDWMITRARLGHDGTRFTIPLYAPNSDLRSSAQVPEVLQTIRFRRDDAYGTEDEVGRPLPKYAGIRGRNGLFLYPEHFLARDHREWVVVVEGELDALRLWQEDIPSITVTNGAGNLERILPLLQRYPRLKRLYLAGDQDAPGRTASENLMAVALNAGYEVSRAWWPGEDAGGTKDVTDLYRADPHGLRGGKGVEWYGADVGLPD